MIVEIDNGWISRKFNKVQPEDFSLAHLIVIQNKLKATVADIFRTMADTGIDDIQNLNKNTVFLSVATDKFADPELILDILPLIYLNENEDKFRKATYNERKEFFENVTLTTEMENEVGEFITTWVRKYFKTSQQHSNP